MTDTRPKALEKAKERAAELKRQENELMEPKPLNAQPSGEGFESERKRANQALRNQLNSYNGQQVQKIAAVNERGQEDRILRVAAYCRVSTDDIDQAISIELQKDNYRKMIRENPQWKFVGLYVDDGFSGTNIDHRPAFRKMMKDALSGKIDMIVTKAVSRFARNLLDCMTWVGKLKDHDPPIAVFFEQEHINTLDTTSNLILVVLAMVAQEESHMKSEAMLLSLEWRLSRGRFLTPALLGYDKVKAPDGMGGEKKMLVINEDQAQTVRLMYYMLLNGSTLTEIAETLTDLERHTGGYKKDGTPNTTWTASRVASALRNERYCGDVLARKTWTPDYRDHKSKKNRGKKNKYYQAGHHEAIVTRAQWNAAQRILNSHGYSGSYLPMRVITDGALKGCISMNRFWAGFELDEYYRVCSIAMGLQEGELETDLSEEQLPDGGHPISVSMSENGIQQIARELSEAEKRIKAQLEGRVYEEEQTETKKIKPGFQVVSGEMFTHAFEPVVRFTRNSISFNSTCISKMTKVYENDGAVTVRTVHYVEMLINPVERMLVVRPCAPENPNALKWCTENGTSCQLGASAFCNLVYAMMNWDTDYTFRVPATVRSRGDETVIFFDLDNFIGREIAKKPENPEKPKQEQVGTEEEEEQVKGIFFGAEDDDEPETIIDVEEMERRIQEAAEVERQNFGTPIFEHTGGVRMPAIDEDGEWNVMAEAKPLEQDHRVDVRTVETLTDTLMEAMFGPAEDPKDNEDKIQDDDAE